MDYNSESESESEFDYQYCDGCNYLYPSEAKQQSLRKYNKNLPDHKCSKSGRRILHKDKHPKLPRPINCPLINIEDNKE